MSVLVALLMVPLLGFAAISIDIAAVHSDRQKLQMGADAAALAIAQDCSRNNCETTRARTTAGQLVDMNTSQADNTVSVDLVASAGKVTVDTSGTREHLFAPVLGIDESEVGATSTAGWGSPISGTAALPLAFYVCEFWAQTGGGKPSDTVERTIDFAKTSNTDCPVPQGNLVPGGFGWLAPNAGTCQAFSRIGQEVQGAPGNKGGTSCMSSLHNKTILLPLFDQYRGQGNNAYYRVYNYAAFTITGYHLSGARWNSPCSGNERCIKGYFTEFLDRSDDFQYGPSTQNLGASAVYLLPDN
ncbi:pilus assembly protein TadG-related protein [Dietzia sp. PP-33]|uniref:pilus assembly protein TadG-related protein n=1 Tax=Dietzia sp. PP-33 TaxID=2957500 RepID=UPI0029A6278A|nr:pilus assembly protein TadG-related protein [Dietzia sp. PP-33]MDX2356285.1 pilus assembly protein TadG-related protein [Dietzia sp. PP-33]